MGKGRWWRNFSKPFCAASRPDAHRAGFTGGADIVAELCLIAPFEEWRRYLAEAHLLVVNVELRFVKAWAEQIGMAIPEIGLEMENPLRNWSDNHPALIKRLLQHPGWDPPIEDELQTARQFWRRILTGDG